MPMFRFETTEFGQITTFVEELASSDLAGTRASDKAQVALAAGVPACVDQSASVTKVYDEAGYLVATINFSDVLRDNPELQPESRSLEEPGVMRSG